MCSPLAIIVKDEAEHWDVATPTLHGSDASHDLKAVRSMIDAGSGQAKLRLAPHWRGESGEANFATATASSAC